MLDTKQLNSVWFYLRVVENFKTSQGKCNKRSKLGRGGPFFCWQPVSFARSGIWGNVLLRGAKVFLTILNLITIVIESMFIRGFDDS